MSTQQTRYPGTGSTTGTGIVWTDAGNITADDAAFAFAAHTAGPTPSRYLVGSNFGFEIPAGAVIDGVVGRRIHGALR